MLIDSRYKYWDLYGSLNWNKIIAFQTIMNLEFQSLFLDTNIFIDKDKSRNIFNRIDFRDVINIALNFDFNKYRQQGDITFEEKFMSITTNELGFLIIPSTAEVIVRQFRIMMGHMAFKILFRQNEEISYYPNFIAYNKDRVNYFTLIYHFPSIFDAVWRLLTMSTKVYEEYCFELWGGFIDRIDTCSTKFSKHKLKLRNYIYIFT